MNSPAAYYKILGVMESATLEEIRRAYKNRAKELHPDRNQAPGAHELFIQLSEAYQYALDRKLRKRVVRKPFSPTSAEQKKREHVRERAHAYSRMKYEEFVRAERERESEIEKKYGTLFRVLDQIHLALMVIVYLVIPIFAIAFDGVEGGVMSFIVMLILLPYAVQVIRDFKK